LPVYNGQEYVEGAIESLLAQTFEDFELIISDNASSDGTEEICRRYVEKDRRVRYCRNEENLGGAFNFNRTFELATGEYFKWAGHDDRCEPSLIARCVEVLDGCPEAVLCYPKTVEIDAENRRIRDYEDRMDIRHPRAADRLRHVFRNLVMCNCVFGLIRSDVLGETGLLGNYPASDVVLLSELSLFGQFREIPEKLFLRRLHPGRSLEANPSYESLAVWFDPANRDKLIPPKTKFFVEYLRAVRRSRLSACEKIDCCKVVYDEWFRKYWRWMGGEAKIIIRHKLGLPQPAGVCRGFGK
jgi:glycosyltransferase involved in cell wall biosynthesis